MNTSIRDILNSTFTQAIFDAFATPNINPIIQLAARSEFGDYQANFAMGLAKELKKNPREVATQVVEKLKDNKLFSKLEIAGPGFINITLEDDFLNHFLQKLMLQEKTGASETKHNEIVVVEYPSANAAKEMHVGHLRPAIIGDALARIFIYLGYNVIKQNHLGDWGTQFGMLIEHLFTSASTDEQHHISDLNAFYQQAKKRFDDEPGFADRARQRTVELQQGEPRARELWKKIIDESENHFEEVYKKLGLLISREDTRGESFYNDQLDDVTKELADKNLLELSDGAKVIFLEGFVDQNNKPLPLIVRKSDGAALYATTDLAALRYRIKTLHASRIIYMTDARQKQHFAMFFAAGRKAGWITPEVRVDHIPFGSILGEDHKPFKTRSGESIKLAALLNEAQQRAKNILKEKNSTLSEEQQEIVANAIGIGALKYADLSNDKIRDYVFNWDSMLSFEGNTAPYLQNAYVRICALFRKGNVDMNSISFDAIKIINSFEHQLSVKICGFSDVLISVADDLNLHRLCAYLYELASLFHRFYEHCPILNNDDKEIKTSRLALAAATARIVKIGLSLLGIQVIEFM
jgi:arginyl-tRNA synthetase